MDRSRPNIILFVTDDQNREDLACYGGKVLTPHIDRLAREGMLFERCYVGNSICAPSRATLLTGKHSHINGFRKNDDRFDGNQTTFPKLLQQAGYQTALIGKWHLGWDWHKVDGKIDFSKPVKTD